VFIAETFAIRSWMFHVGNGALSASLGWTLTRDLRDEHHFLGNPTILVAAGIAAGFAYWLIAGWTAGFWKAVGASPGPPRAQPQAGRGGFGRPVDVPIKDGQENPVATKCQTAAARDLHGADDV
jgi:hypothetical protein